MIKEVLPNHLEASALDVEYSLNSDDQLRKFLILEFSKRMLNSGLITEAVAIVSSLEESEKKYLDKLEAGKIADDSFTYIFIELINEFLEELNKGSAYNNLFSFLMDNLEISFREYRERQKELIKLKQQSDIDTLTQLPKRVTLAKDFNNLLEQRRRADESSFSLVILDIDHFKKVNDTYGHLFGDEVLKYVVDSLKNLIREGDKVYRYGGEEFIILTKGNEQDVKVLLERILNHFRENNAQILSRKKVEFSKKEIIDLTLLISIGSVSSEQIDENKWSLDNFIFEADNALYYVKKNGRNNIFQVGIDRKSKFF